MCVCVWLCYVAQILGNTFWSLPRSGSISISFTNTLLFFSREVMSDSTTPWPAAHFASLSFTISQSLLKLMFIESAMPSKHINLLSPSPPLNISKQQDLFQWFGSLHQVVLPVNSQDWSPLELTGLISLQSKGLSSVFSNTTVQKHQFFSTQPSLWPNSHIRTWLLETP